MRVIVLFALLFSGCVRPHVLAPMPETFEQTLQRTEGVSCADITEHAEGETPDCRKIYDAWMRGKLRVVAIYPDARNFRMSAVLFYRPVRVYVPEKPYPLINLGPLLVRGVTSPSGVLFVEYAYEAVIEHEATHAIVRWIDPGRLRSPEDIAQSPPNQQAPEFFQITCHGTVDDPFGEPGNSASCVQ